MQNIQLLDSRTINKIAAGEVVESPKSVVKELTENAIDAGASAVTVEIKNGGISYIRVTDNGCGIPKEQVKTAFLRHATSKLYQIEDLEHLFTLGFRGEALASIAAVAQVELLTKTREEESGTRICIHAGKIERLEDAACKEGTSVTVKNLFYNVPARRKFLKKPTTESAHVADLVNKLALGHPEVSIQYINNETTILHTAGNNDLKTAVFYVYGKEAAKQMLPLSYQKGEYRLSGLIGKPELCRANRNYENLFINGRFIKNKVVSDAVEEAYKTRQTIGKFPLFVLNLEVPPAEVDVNVHPAKLEVRFQEEDAVYDFFYTAVSSVLQGEVLIPMATMAKPSKAVVSEQEHLQRERAAEETDAEQQTKPLAEQSEEGKADRGSGAEIPQASATHATKATMQQTTETIEKAVGEATEEAVQKPKKPLFSATARPTGGTRIEELLGRKRDEHRVRQEPLPYERTEQTAQVALEEMTQTAEKKQPFFKDYTIIGQVFRTYWLIEQGESLYLIDQHAAHERVLYEELMNRFRAETVVSQRLVEPLLLQLTFSEKQTLQENRALLESFGFGLEEFAGTFALCATPYLLKRPTSVGFFTEILDRLAEEPVRNLYDTKLLEVATMACKAAVKGHDVLSVREAEALLHQVLQLEQPFTCPHGRPTIVALTKYELEKLFRRVQS